MQKICKEDSDISHNLTKFENELMKGIIASLSPVVALLFRVGPMIGELVTELGLLIAMGMTNPQVIEAKWQHLTSKALVPHLSKQTPRLE